MHTIDHVLNRIRAYAAARGWKKSRLAAEAGLSDNALKHLNNPSWNPNVSTIRSIERLIPDSFVASDDHLNASGGGV